MRINSETLDRRLATGEIIVIVAIVLWFMAIFVPAVYHGLSTRQQMVMSAGNPPRP